MRTDDLLALSDHPCAEHQRVFERRSAAIGFILAAALLIMAWAGAYWARPTKSVALQTDETEFSATAKALERSGTLSGLEILW